MDIWKLCELFFCFHFYFRDSFRAISCSLCSTDVVDGGAVEFVRVPWNTLEKRTRLVRRFSSVLQIIACSPVVSSNPIRNVTITPVKVFYFSFHFRCYQTELGQLVNDNVTFVTSSSSNRERAIGYRRRRNLYTSLCSYTSLSVTIVIRTIESFWF